MAKGKMEMKKWIINLSLVATLFICVMSGNDVLAASSNYSISDVSIKKGEDTSFTVSISSAQTETYYGMTLYFPLAEQDGTGFFSLDELSVGGGILPSTMDTNTGVIYWADLSLAGKEIAAGGAIATAKYNVSSSVVAGTYNVPVRVSAINASSDDENFVLAATVTVTDGEEKPKDPSPQPPEMTAGLRIAEGSTLSELGSRTPGFNWVDADEVVKAGQNTYKATYTYNNDTTNYTTISVDVPVYGLKYVKVTVTKEGEGGYNAPLLDRVLEGTEVEIRFIPADGYDIASVTKDGTNVTSSLVNNVLKFTVGTSNVDIAVVFTGEKYTFTIIGNNVTTDPSGIFTVSRGADQSIIITTNYGYILASVRVNDEEKIREVVGNTITIHDVKEDTVVVVTAERIEYYFVRGDGQKITVDTDEDVVFEINADASLFKQGGELYIDDVLVDPEYYTVSGTTTVITISLDYLDTLEDGTHTLKAVFGDGGVAMATFTVEGLLVPNTGGNTFEISGSLGGKMLPMVLGCVAMCAVMAYAGRHKVRFEKKR